MATIVKLIDESHGRSKEGGRWVSTGQRVYEVKVDDPSAYNCRTIKTVSGIPAAGSVWETGAAERVVGKSARRVSQDEKHRYLVTVDYAQTEIVTDDNPLNAPALVTQGTTDRTEAYFEDVDDDLVLNSAGQPFANQPEREVVATYEFTITKNVATRDDGTLRPFIKTLNNASVTIDGTTLTQGQAFLHSVSHGPEQTTTLESGTTVNFYERTVRIIARASWDDVFDDVGFRDLNGYPKVNEDGTLVETPWPLDGSGAFKANATDTPATITRKPYALATWPALW